MKQSRGGKTTTLVPQPHPREVTAASGLGAPFQVEQLLRRGRRARSPADPTPRADRRTPVGTLGLQEEVGRNIPGCGCVHADTCPVTNLHTQSCRFSGSAPRPPSAGRPTSPTHASRCGRGGAGGAGCKAADDTLPRLSGWCRRGALRAGLGAHPRLGTQEDARDVRAEPTRGDGGGQQLGRG